MLFRSIVMQYPLRSIEPLKALLHGKKNIVYVENKKNFEAALKTAVFSEYFSDTFAHDFGHCRPKGNRLIADHLADVIQENFFSPLFSAQ